MQAILLQPAFCGKIRSNFDDNLKLFITKSPIYINGRFLTQQITGVQTFALELCREFIQNGIPLIILMPKNAVNTTLEFENLIERIGMFSGHLWEQFDLAMFMKKRKGAVLLNLCNTGPVSKVNQVVTIHDLAFIKNPKWFHPIFATWYRIMVPQLVRKGRIIITVSESVKSELIQAFQISIDKILVVGNKVSNRLLNAESLKPDHPEIAPLKYFLMVGSNDPRKNFLFVEKFFSDKNNEYVLVIIGANHKNFADSHHSLNENIIRLGYLSMGNLKWLYENAIGLINPSLYEGFGIPNLEAMALGCPVLCSEIPVFREICANSAFYFNPINGGSLNDCIHEVLENKMLRESKTLSGKVIFTGFQNQNRIQTIQHRLSQ